MAHLRTRLRALACIVVVMLTSGSARARADDGPIDVDRSRITIFVYKSGLFSAFADNHVVSARVASGSLSDSAPLSVAIVVKARDLNVVDPDLPAAKRAEVQARMLGPDVLDTATYGDITFTSTGVEPAGSAGWKVTGLLTLHGRSRTIVLDARREGGAFVGSVLIRQRDFGIAPISIAGGAVKVRDELKVTFAIVSQGNPVSPDGFPRQPS